MQCNNIQFWCLTVFFFSLIKDIYLVKKKKLNIQKTKIMASAPIISWEIDRETVERGSELYFWGDPKSIQMVIATMKFKDAYSLERKL